MSDIDRKPKLKTKTPANNPENISNQPENNDIQDAAITVGVSTAIGVGVSTAVGGMGLVVAGTGISIGAAPIAAGAIIGAAAHGAKKAVEDQDAIAISAVVAGAGLGAGASAVLGGMGLAVAGTAIGVTMAPLAAAGAIIGLAGYGVARLFGDPPQKNQEEEEETED